MNTEINCLSLGKKVLGERFRTKKINERNKQIINCYIYNYENNKSTYYNWPICCHLNHNTQ